MIKITQLANAGLLLEAPGARLLVDALFSLPAPGFSAPSGQMLDSALRGGVDCLLVTHRHPDHFSEELAERYAAHGDLAEILLPETEPGQTVSRPGWSVEVIRTGHLAGGNAFGAVPHNCYLIDLFGVRLLITADAEFRVPKAAKAFCNARADVIFVNPVFFSNSVGQRILRDCAPRLVCVYHVPFLKDDIGGLRRLAAGSLRRFGSAHNRVEALMEEGQTLFY